MERQGQEARLAYHAGSRGQTTHRDWGLTAALALLLLSPLCYAVSVKALRNESRGDRADSYPAPSFVGVLDDFSDDEGRQYPRHLYPVARRTGPDRGMGVAER